MPGFPLSETRKGLSVDFRTPITRAASHTPSQLDLLGRQCHGGPGLRLRRRFASQGDDQTLLIIQQAIWLCVRFTLSFRDVEDLLAERGILVSYESVRRWVNHERILARPRPGRGLIRPLEYESRPLTTPPSITRKGKTFWAISIRSVQPASILKPAISGTESGVRSKP